MDRRTFALMLGSAALAGCAHGPRLGMWDRCRGVDPGDLAIVVCPSPPMRLSALVIHPVHQSGLTLIRRQTYGEPVWRPVAGELIAVLGAGDYAPEDLRRTDLPRRPDAALWRAARHNLDRLSGRAEIEPVDGVLEVIIPGAEYRHHILAFSEALWRRREFGGFKGPPAFGFSSPRTFLVADSGEPAAVQALRDRLAADLAASARWQDGRWQDTHTFSHSPRGDIYLRHPDGQFTVLP
jgi:hypothetical protein